MMSLIKMFCWHCGAVIMKDVHKCPECGGRLTTTVDGGSPPGFKKVEPNWNELDGAARRNLNPYDFMKYQARKGSLKWEGREWYGDAYETLSGFIWDCLEGYEDAE